MFIGVAKVGPEYTKRDEERVREGLGPVRLEAARG